MATVAYPELVETARLRLRRWRHDDAAAAAAIWADAAVWDVLGAGHDRGRAQVAASSHSRQAGHWDDHGFGFWLIEAAGQPGVVGWCGAWYPDFVPDLRGEIEIGWTLRRPFWGRGYATEAARAAVATTFEHLEPARVISLIAPGNHRSAAVATRLGMRLAGDTRTERDLTLGVYELARPAG